VALILVVDDEPDIRELIAINLEAAGHRVATAGNGAEALAAVKVEAPDVIFLDVMMPNVDGWTVLDTLKSESDADLASIPVFMVTGMAAPEHRVRGGIEGAVRYITKPFDPAKLVAAVADVLAPDAPSEPELRRQVQRQSLEALARLERSGGAEASLAVPDEPRVRLTRLEHAPVVPTQSPRLRAARDKLADLTDKQRELLLALADGEPVVTVAKRIDTSRSNIYASLRRISRRLGLSGTDELLALVRQGMLQERR